MASYTDTPQVVVPDTQVLDKVASNTTPEKHSFHSIHPSFKKRLRRFSFLMSTNLDRVMPSHRVYCGCNRRVLLIFCTVVFFVVLIAAIGLGLGLRKGSESQNLPLPSNSKSFKGDLTYYSPALGACGITSSDSDNICAVSHIVFDAVSKGSNPNANPLCGLIIRATRFDERSKSQRSVDLKVVDRCTGCAATDIDLSPSAFKKLADPALGRVGVTWAWLSPTPNA